MLQFPIDPKINLANIIHFPNFFDSKEINNILSNSQTLSSQKGNTDKEEMNHHRNSRIKWIPQLPPWYWVFNKIHTLTTNANNSCWDFNLIGFEENIQYTEYHSTDLGHMNWHIDCGTSISSHRKISITIQLSDPSEYEGGDLEFFIGGDYSKGIIKCPKSKGYALAFPSYVLHRVTPITKGIRKSLVLWVGGDQFR